MKWDNWVTDWKTTEEQRASYDGWQPMFPGSMFGGPSFVQYGKDNAGATDGYVYAVSGDQWDNGRFLRLGRVPKNQIMQKNAWEFARLDKKGDPTWHKDINDSGPILDIEGHISLPEMVYIAAVKKYILLTWGLHSDFNQYSGSELTILEADNPWGPFKLLHYEWMWIHRANCPYTPRIPLKWYNAEENTGYILHSGRWGSDEYYRPQARKFRLGKVSQKL